ncbi:MAG: hypothetical protein MK135_11845 [Polyangiaceae bacterium]|nr:hypothetical protein [Polyangiaceae bacterium]
MSLPRRSASLVVIEFSASWPRWLKVTGANNAAVVAQHYAGPPSSLVTQVATRVSRLSALNWQVDEIILVSNGRIDADSVTARAVIARGLLARLRQQGQGHLRLTVEQEASKRAISDLRKLINQLDRSTASSELNLSLRVGERSWESLPGGQLREESMVEVEPRSSLVG